MMHHGPMGHLASLPEGRAQNRSRVVLRLIQRLRPYRLAVFASLLLVLANAAAQAAGPFLIGLAIDRYISGGDEAGLGQAALLLASVYLASMLSMRYQIYLMSWAGQHVLADMRREIMNRVQSLSVQYLESRETGDLMSRLVNDIDAINSFLSQGLIQSLGSLFALIGIVIAMLVLNWKLALASFTVIPFMLLATGQFSRMARRAFRKTRETIGDVSAELQEELGGVKVAQAFNRSEMNIRHFAERNAANRDANVSANAVTSAFAPAMSILSTFDMAIVAGFGGYLAIQGEISVGVVVAFLTYVQNFFRPIQTVATIWTSAQSAFAASERVFELIDTEPAVVDTPGAVDLSQNGSERGEVVFEHVNFGYEQDDLVLEDISFEAGREIQTVALVGPTGAGKSTLVGLLMRFFDTNSGRILVNGRDIRSVTQKSLRSQMAIVLQEPFLFSGTILDNIRYGRLDATDKEVIEAAKIANAHDFIERFSEGYQTRIGERGGTLSQGQRQLISIARAILANPRILILDEATASVDTRTEVLIQKALNRLLKGRTSFVIAHRLSTVRTADLVLVLENGKIVERGTHDELIQQNGLYAELYQRQFYTPQDPVQMKEPVSEG